MNLNTDVDELFLIALMKALKDIKQLLILKSNEHFCEQVYLTSINVLQWSKATTLISTSLNVPGDIWKISSGDQIQCLSGTRVLVSEIFLGVHYYIFCKVHQRKKGRIHPFFCLHKYMDFERIGYVTALIVFSYRKSGLLQTSGMFWFS